MRCVSLIAVTLCLSSVQPHAQDTLSQTSLEQASPLPLERLTVRIQLPADWILGRISAVALGRAGEAYVLQRGDKADPVIVVDRSGRVLRSWGKGMFKIAHSIKVDPDGHVWTTDAGDGRVLKFTRDGKKLQEIALSDAPVGKDCGFPSAAVNNYIDACGTTDIMFMSGGRVFLTDGYGKMRVLEYSADGKRIREWGGQGDGPGRFHVPHGLAYDGKGVVFVADRDAGRLQRFDPTGRYLGEWTNLGRVGALHFFNGALWAATGVRSAPSQTPGAAASWVIKVDPATGRILGKIETTNADFIDISPNGDVVAGAGRDGFSWYRPTR
jgi:hypothetical protein